MTTTQSTRTSSWWERLSERCYRTTMPQLVRDMQHEASHSFGGLLDDLSVPLDSTFEREVARQLNLGQPIGFVPARTLMPVMMQRFGLAREDFAEAEAPQLATLTRTCNGCPLVGHCWRALRHGAEVEECRGFCPNAEAFEEKAASA